MKYDIAIIGAGPAGYEGALYAARTGLSVVLFENRELGGTCLNRGCIPTKSLLHAAELAQSAGAAAQFGIVCENVRTDAGTVFAQKDAAVQKLREGIAAQLKSAGVKIVYAHAEITAQGCVSAGGESYSAENIVVACGGKPSLPPISGIQLDGVVDSDGLLALGRIPEKIAIIGGGVIGCEFATALLGLGSQVSIVEALPGLLAGMDGEIGRSLAMQLKKDGAQVFTSATVSEIVKDGAECAVVFKTGDAENRVCADTVLVATGRRADVSGLFAADIKPETSRGALVTDAQYRTSVAGVYAVGDARFGAVQLAHAATAEGINAVRIIAGKPPLYDMSLIPSCVYTSPEIACVGLSADAAKQRGTAVKTGKALMGANGRSVLCGAKRGFIKLVFDAETDVVLGAALMCERATDLIGEWTLAVERGLTAEQLEGVVRAHPTFYEAAAAAVQNRR